jgi:general secretion pathway protein G
MSENSGFTLIELILVTVIIGILAGMVTLTFGGRAEEARVRATLGDIKSYESAIELYALEHNDQYPGKLEDLVHSPTKNKSYIRQLNTDPWGNQYVYKEPGEQHPSSYDILSMGPDGELGTEDDIAPWLVNASDI